MAQNKPGEYPSDHDPKFSHLSENSKGTPSYRELNEERAAKRAKQNASERFVRLGHDLTGSPAWQALGVYARDAYVWIERRYSGKNNGKIPMALSELASVMGVNKKTAHKALKRLQAFGFLAVQQKGHMGWHGDAQRHATRWRLTEYWCGGNQASRDYMDLSVAEAERRYNLYFPRATRGDATSPEEVRTRATTGHVAKMADPETEEAEVGTCPPAPRSEGSTYSYGAQSIASEARGDRGTGTAEDHQHARVPPATGRSSSTKKRKAVDVLGNGFHKS